jgi:hypothetical protein
MSHHSKVILHAVIYSVQSLALPLLEFIEIYWICYKQLGSTGDIPLHVSGNMYQNISHKFLLFSHNALLFNVFIQFNKSQQHLQ